MKLISYHTNHRGTGKNISSSKSIAIRRRHVSCLKAHRVRSHTQYKGNTNPQKRVQQINREIELLNEEAYKLYEKFNEVTRPDCDLEDKHNIPYIGATGCKHPQNIHNWCCLALCPKYP